MKNECSVVKPEKKLFFSNFVIEKNIFGKAKKFSRFLSFRELA